MRVPFNQLGSVGVIKDKVSYTLPPAAWSDAYNIRFFEGTCYFMGGWEKVFDPPTVQPWYVQHVLNNETSYWLYLGVNKAYVYDGSAHTDITRAVGGNYAPGIPRAWHSTNFGGIPIFNNGVDVPQYWTGFGSANKLADLTNWPGTLRAKLIRSFGKYGVALNLTAGGVPLPHALQWSHPADPGALPASWDITDATKEAGRRELTDSKGGGIQDGLSLGNQFVIYKKGSTHVMRYIGGNEIMGLDLLLSETGILASRCVCSTKKGEMHFVVTEDDVIVHKGTKEATSVVDGKNRTTLFNDIDTDNYLNTFVIDYPLLNEVWICYPTKGSVYPNKAMVWNHKGNTVTFRDWIGHYACFGYLFPGAVAWDSLTQIWDSSIGPWGSRSLPSMVAASGDPANTSDKFLFRMDYQNTGNTVARTAYLERTNIPFILEKGEVVANYDITKYYDRLWVRKQENTPDFVYFDVQEASANQTSLLLDAAHKYTTDGITPIDLMKTGTLCGYRFEWTNKSNMAFDQLHLDMIPVGENQL